ncbi:unnamed protein product [Arabidopsis thaliana]|uniref:Uncharacterized protein n=1 Tax=Arabidopsis thaliana TaxID=3702 RepID=A0A654FMF0_ARATH|nr:unnamed protein product [Arabidopsis thaliana]
MIVLGLDWAYSSQDQTKGPKQSIRSRGRFFKSPRRASYTEWYKYGIACLVKERGIQADTQRQRDAPQRSQAPQAISSSSSTSSSARPGQQAISSSSSTSSSTRHAQKAISSFSSLDRPARNPSLDTKLIFGNQDRPQAISLFSSWIVQLAIRVWTRRTPSDVRIILRN